jgi:hypothetical protein
MVSKRGGVGTHRHEPGVSEGKLAHVTIHQVEARGQDDVDAYVHQQHLDVIVEEVESRNGERENHAAQSRSGISHGWSISRCKCRCRARNQTFCTLG